MPVIVSAVGGNLRRPVLQCRMGKSMYKRHQADSCRYNLRRVNAIVVHNDLIESARIKYVVFVSVQGAAIRFSIKSQTVTAITF